jgi:hypothetical protein
VHYTDLETDKGRELLQLVIFGEEDGSVNFSVHQDGGRPSTGIPEVPDTETRLDGI